jgi:hypothetical protein
MVFSRSVALLLRWSLALYITGTHRVIFMLTPLASRWHLKSIYQSRVLAAIFQLQSHLSALDSGLVLPKIVHAPMDTEGSSTG